MKLNLSDWKLMRGSVIAFSLALASSILLIYISSQYAERASKTWHNAQQQLTRAKASLNAAQQEHDNINSYLQPYQRAQQQHLIGVEPRLNWVESLEKLRLQNLVSSFSYNIDPQKTITLPIDTGNFEVHFSAMKLQIELRDEVQLLNFLDALRSQVPGWYRLDSCTLTRHSPTGAGLKAECDGGWLTLQNKSAP
jgi:hypothetical protein